MQPGSGILEFTKVGSQTVLTRALACSPLRVLTPQNHGQFAWAYLSSFGGGMVDGDCVDLELQIRSGARAALMSQSATKIYRSPQGTSQRIRAEIGEGATLASLPDPVICFKESRFHQRQDYHLAADASLIVLDSLISGRHCAGERWAFTRYQSEIRVWRQGQPIFFDSILLDPDQGPLVDRLGRFDSLATLLMIGPAWESGTRAALAQVEAARLPKRSPLVACASPLGADGAILRLASQSTEALGEACQRFLDFLPGLFGDNPWTRKW